MIDVLRKSENEEVSEEEFCEFLKTNVSMEEMKDLFRKSNLDEDLFYEYTLSIFILDTLKTNPFSLFKYL